MDWTTAKDIVQIIVGFLTLAMTGLGAAWALYIGYRTKAIELAAKQAATRDRRKSHRLKKLCRDTEAQTKQITETQQTVTQLEKNTNGNLERLLKEATEKAYLQGKSDAAKEATNPPLPPDTGDGRK